MRYTCVQKWITQTKARTIARTTIETEWDNNDGLNYLTRHKGRDVRVVDITHTASHVRVTREVEILDEKSSWPFWGLELNLANLDFQVCLFWGSLYVPFEEDLLVVYFCHRKRIDVEMQLSDRNVMKKMGFLSCAQFSLVATIIYKS